MKVAIDPFGNMTIQGETAAEEYTLRKWWDDWQAHRVCLGVRISDDTGIASEFPIKCRAATEGESG